MNVLLQRILTSLVLIPLIIFVVVFTSESLFALILTLIFFLAVWEWAHLTGFKYTFSKALYLLILAMILFTLYHNSTNQLGIWIALIAILWWCYCLFLVFSYQNERVYFSAQMHIRSLYGYCLFIPAWLSMLLLYRNSDDNSEWVLVFLILIWLADSAAFFIGQRFGKNKLAKNVSPGKSWEGVFGGIMTVSFIAVVYAQWRGLPMTVFIMICLLTALLSVLGDLFESLAKRSSNLKDSGNLLPGHGGVLDRIDSLLAAAPVFFLGVLYMKGFI